MRHPKAPIFANFTNDQLELLTGYSVAYLEDLRRGKQPIRPRFRRSVARMLGQAEEALFGSDGDDHAPSEPATSSSDSSDVKKRRKGRAA